MRTAVEVKVSGLPAATGSHVPVLPTLGASRRVPRVLVTAKFPPDTVMSTFS